MKVRITPTSSIPPRIEDESNREQVTVRFWGQSGGRGVFAEVTVSGKGKPNQDIELSEFVWSEQGGDGIGSKEWSQAALDGAVWALNHSCFAQFENRGIKIEKICVNIADTSSNDIFYATYQAVCFLLEIETTPKLTFHNREIVGL